MNDIDYSNYEELGLRDAQIIMAGILKEVADICDKYGIKYFLDAGTLIGAVRHKGFIPWDDDIDIGMLREDYRKFLSIIKDELPEHLFLQTHENDLYYDIYQVPCKIRYNNTLFIEEKIVENPKMHNGLFIDILPYDSLPKKKWVYTIQRKISNFILRSFVRCREIPEKLTFKNKLTHFIYKIVVKIFSTQRRQKLFDFLINWNDINSEYMGYGVDTTWSEYIYKKKDFFDLIKVEFEGEYFYAPKNYDAVLTQLYGDYMTLPKEEDRVWHAKTIKKLSSMDN
jgi:lipopolysaccharide cholinephosphotransferase